MDLKNLKFFTDISQFDNISDYLPILLGVLNAEIMLLVLVFNNILRSSSLKGWYHTFNLNAIILDCCILILGIILTRFFYPFLFSTWNLVFFIILSVVIQIIHEFIFYLWFRSLPLGFNKIFDYMKKYAKNVGGYAIFGDSILIASSSLLASHFASYSLNIQIIFFIIALYNIPYMIYMR